MLPIYVTADEGHAAYLGTAEDIAAIEAFGREYQFAGPVEDADFAADSVLADLRRDGDIDPTAEAKLRAALIVCAVRLHGARRSPWILEAAGPTNAAPPEPRKPVAGWETGHVPGYSARRAAPILRRGPICVRAEERGWEMIAESDNDDVASIQIEAWPATSLEAAQLAAEDALFSVADGINALRGGR